MSHFWSVRTIALVAVGALVLAGCGGGSVEDPQEQEPTGQSGDDAAAAPEGPIDLLVIAPFTGPLATVLGSDTKGAIDAVVALWNEQHPERPVEVTTCDDQTDSTQAINCVNRYAADSDVVVGPLVINQYEPARQLLEQSKLHTTPTPFSGVSPDTYSFQASPTIELAWQGGFGYMKEQGWDKVAVLTTTDATGNAAQEVARATAGEAGVEVIVEQYDATAEDITPQVRRVLEQEPEAVFVWSAGPQVATALRSLKNANSQLPVMLNFASTSYGLMKLAEGSLPETLLFASFDAMDADAIDDPERKALVTAFDEAFTASTGTPPASNAYQIGDALLVALTAALHGEDADAMRAYLERGEPVVALTTSYRYGPDDHVGVDAASNPISVVAWNGEDFVIAP